MDIDHHAFPASTHHTKLVAHEAIGKFGCGCHSQHHLAKPSLTTSGPEIHKRKSNEEPAYEPPNGVGGRDYSREDVEMPMRMPMLRILAFDNPGLEAVAGP